MKKILVTGGLGFVGVNLVPKLLAIDNTLSVCIVDNLSYTAVPEALEKFLSGDRVRWIRADICNAGAWEFAMDGVDCVIHLAAQTFVDNAIKTPVPFVYTNVIGTQVVCELVKKYKVPLFIHASTDEVFGEATGVIEFSEESPYRPRNPYAASKAAADHIVSAYGTTYDLPYQIVHFCNLYGPFQYPEKLVPKTIVQLLTDQTIGLYGNGQQVREWLHVADACDAVLRTLERGKLGESYIIGSGERLTNYQIVRMIAELVGRDENCIKYIEDRPGHDIRYAVSSKKARRELGWSPVFSLQQGLSEVVVWYRNHIKWWSKRTHANKV